ncbi:hypothetical protein N7520_002009 [Penicillium odoratum]|uniref:uncharacterized protein n=1 Tax=Penicillium odoratum TaxID=1167516 RepID=UPI002548D5FA|nr:uncharacterized protein N7520_002009 [Penicillium odoratum]KAJ5778763.1 hypothetical protein N7520_002009 [Penicillium odoratum]
MIAFHIALYAILATSLVFAIIELGLCAYVASVWGGTREELYYDSYGDLEYGDVNISIPGILAFLIFTSCWTMLVTPGGVLLSWFYTRKGATGKISTILGVVFSVVYFITMVFWLACFADIASDLDGYTSHNDYLNAVIAFAVLLWLLFLALFILSVLSLCGVLVSDWVGYQSMRKQGDRATEPAPAATEVPMSTNPVASPSELSTRDAETLHDQPNNHSHSVSSPSAMASVELSADTIHDHQASHA